MAKLSSIRIPSFIKNKYVLTVIGFALWMIFFDQYTLYTQYKFKQELNQLEKDKEYYEREITKAAADLNELMTNDNQLEKFAREKYLMKRDNEEIFVIITPTE